MGGVRRGAGRPADPNSMRSQIRGLSGKEGFVTLPAEGRTDPAPGWPLDSVTDAERELWERLWAKPQALMWEIQGLEFAVAMYVRSYFEGVEPGASAGLKTAVLRMEGELGLSLLGMKTLGWQIEAGEDAVSAGAVSKPLARRTPTDKWLEAVRVEGS